MRIDLHILIPLWVVALTAWVVGGFMAVSGVAVLSGHGQIKHDAARYLYLVVGGPLLWLALTYSWWTDTPKTARRGRLLAYRVGGRWVKGPAWPVWVIGDTLKIGTRSTGLLVSLRRDGLHDTSAEGDS